MVIKACSINLLTAEAACLVQLVAFWSTSDIYAERDGWFKLRHFGRIICVVLCKFYLFKNQRKLCSQHRSTPAGVLPLNKWAAGDLYTHPNHDGNLPT